MSQGPNLWIFQRKQCPQKSGEKLKPLHMWFKNADGIQAYTCMRTHVHVMISYKAEISVGLLSPVSHRTGDACLSPTVYCVADPHLDLHWQVQWCSSVHKHSKMFLAWKLFSYALDVYVGWQMHTLECVNGYLGTVALPLANFSWHVAWTQRSSQLQGVPSLWDSRLMKKRHYFYIGLFRGNCHNQPSDLGLSAVLGISVLSSDKRKKIH